MATEAAHTPGPWVTDRTTVEDKLAVRAADNKFAICIFEAFVKDHEANARLCAAAPDLYDALSDMVANESMVEAAHAKAGQPYLNTALAPARAALNKANPSPA